MDFLPFSYGLIADAFVAWQIGMLLILNFDLGTPSFVRDGGFGLIPGIFLFLVNGSLNHYCFYHLEALCAQALFIGIGWHFYENYPTQKAKFRAKLGLAADDARVEKVFLYYNANARGRLTKETLGKAVDDMDELVARKQKEDRLRHDMNWQAETDLFITLSHLKTPQQ
jgi:hypothetical protein